MIWPDNPNPTDVFNALRKGLGRAHLWAKKCQVDVDALLEACLNDYRYDTQVEKPRGDWHWRMLQAASLARRVDSAVLAALTRIERSDAQAQLCQLARHFAMHGDQRFRRELRRIVEAKPVGDAPWLAEAELIRVDGDEGFLQAIRRHGADLASREWEWFDDKLVDEGRAWLGSERLIALLDSSTEADADVRRFIDAWRQLGRKAGTQSTLTSYRERIAAYTLNDVIAAAEVGEKMSFWMRGWGRIASDADLDMIHKRMLEVQDVEALRRYLQVFAMRPWPRFDSRFFDLLAHEDENIRCRAASAIARNRHPEVRRLALDLLSDPMHQEAAVEMLATNYEPGDESIVLNALILPHDLDCLHRTLKDLLTLVAENASAVCQEAARLVYEKTPCSRCRHSAVKLLVERERLPDEYRWECCYDVEVDTRSLVGGPAWDD